MGPMCSTTSALRRGALASALTGLLALLSVPNLAWAEQASGEDLLEQALDAYEDLRIEEALDLLLQAERSGDLDEGDMARLHLYRALSRSSLGQEDTAESAFRAALRLNAEISLPEDISPVVLDRFEVIRAQFQAGMTSDPVDPVDPADPIEPVTPPPPPPPPPPRRLRATWAFVGLTGAALITGLTTTILAVATRASVGSGARRQEDVDDLMAAYRVESRLGFVFLSTAAALAVTTLLVWLGERPLPSPPAVASAIPPLGPFVF